MSSVEAEAGPTPFDELLTRARAGGDAAFAALWRSMHPPLLRWLRVVARYGVDDIASEVWLTVVRRLDVFRGGESEFRGWLYTIARRRSIDSARQRRRQPAIEALDGVEPAAGPDASELVVSESGLERAMRLMSS